MNVEILNSGMDSITKGAAVKDDTPVKNPEYPSGLSDPKSPHDSYLIFSIMEARKNYTYRSLKAHRDAYVSNPIQHQPVEYIKLYMPSLTESVSHSYGDSQSSMIADFAGSIVGGAGVWQALKDTAGAKALQEIQNSKAANQYSGQIQKQQNVSLYKGTNLREQTFKFDLIARDATELKNINQIIHLFRTYGSATVVKTTGGSTGALGTVNVPPVWYVEERLRGDYELSRTIQPFFFGGAVITAVNVDKTPEQIYQSVAGTAGDPIHIKLEVKMKELIATDSAYWNTQKLHQGRRLD